MMHSKRHGERPASMTSPMRRNRPVRSESFDPRKQLDFRREAIHLMGDMRPTPIIDQALRAQLNDELIEIRLASYEALAKRHDPFMRRYDVDGKFDLYVVRAEEPMIYITQVSEPRIVIFGDNQTVQAPRVLFEAWSSRLMIQPGLSADTLDVRYRRDIR